MAVFQKIYLKKENGVPLTSVITKFIPFSSFNGYSLINFLISHNDLTNLTIKNNDITIPIIIKRLSHV